MKVNSITSKEYIKLAIPLIIATVTTPLLGAVDTAVVGRLNDPVNIAAIAVGTVFFNTLYWLFGFLRVSTSGFAAQALGAKNEKDSLFALIRPLSLAIIISSILLLLQPILLKIFLPFLSNDADVQTLALQYIKIRLFGVPFALINYCILGWIMGMAYIRTSVLIQISMNVLNIILNLLFVFGFGLGVKGVATATLIAEIFALIIGIFVLWRNISVKITLKMIQEALNIKAFAHMLKMNRDLVIRTVCLLTVFNLFTSVGSGFGTNILAANAVLIQIQYLMVYFYDGLANASSIITGRAIGSKNVIMFKQIIKLSSRWACYFSIGIVFVYFVLKNEIILLFTNIPEVITIIDEYNYWLYLFPIVSCLGVVLYGVFVGATDAKSVRNSMVLALVCYLLTLWLCVPKFGNHGLWMAFIIFSLGRSIFLAMYLPKLQKNCFK